MGGCRKGAEKHAGLWFGINVKGLAIHSRTGKKNQAQETCPENQWSRSGKKQEGHLQLLKIVRRGGGVGVYWWCLWREGEEVHEEN